MELNELRQARAKIVTDQRAILDKADKEKRELSSEETTQYETMDKDFERLSKDISDREQLEKDRLERSANLEAREKMLKESIVAPHKPIPQGDPNAPNPDIRKSKEYEQAFGSLLRVGFRGLNTGELSTLRALQADKDVVGGFTVAPQMFVNDLIMKLDNLVFVRKLAKVLPVVKADSIGFPSLDADPADPTWTGEILTGTEDSSMAFQKRELRPHPLAKRIKVSERLLRLSTIPIEGLVNERLAYKFGIVQENSFLNGTGIDQPLGVFVASASGINTDRDVSQDNAATKMSADNLIECKYTLKAQYRNAARWLFSRTAVKQIRKLKTGEGDYIWKMGISNDKPDAILDLPYDESEYCPSTFTTGQYVGILANWQYYWIADAMDMTVKVLDELYAETSQIGYIGRLETDGMPVIGEAFVRVKLG
jgi:HK97 family phage major capsid protein